MKESLHVKIFTWDSGLWHMNANPHLLWWWLKPKSASSFTVLAPPFPNPTLGPIRLILPHISRTQFLQIGKHLIGKLELFLVQYKYMWAPSPVIVPFRQEICHLVFFFHPSNNTSRAASVFTVTRNWFLPDTMQCTDPVRGWPVPCFIASSPLMHFACLALILLCHVYLYI